jgi:hypothetical protein
MGKEWIEQLAGEIKEKGREPAETYGRQQHQAGIIDAEGKVFFLGLVASLEQDFSEIRSQLQGSAVSAETSVVKDGPAQVKLVRSRFPWFDAVLQHNDADIALDYVQGRGVAGEQTLATSADRQTVHYSLQVDPLDRLSVAEAFGDTPLKFEKPEELAKHIVELLFKV